MPKTLRRCEAPRPHNPLETCGREFIMQHPAQLYCSDRCAQRAHRARRRSKDRTLTTQQLISLEQARRVLEPQTFNEPDRSAEPHRASHNKLPSSEDTIMDILSKYKTKAKPGPGPEDL